MDNLADDCQDWLERCINGDKSAASEDESHVEFEGDSVNFEKTSEERKGTYTRLRNASKPHSTPQTLKWLDENYEIAEGVCIPRSTLYVHYLDYCEKNDTQPVNAASFGKIIRQQFPQLTTRRLGTRGQSKYHYYGIGVRETSVYYEASFSAKGSQGCLDGKKDNVKQIIAYSPRSKLGTLLPEFPDVKEIQLPPSVEEGKVFTFLMMYRTHCQRILDTVIRANFDEVQSFLLHFWQGMPTHIKSILESKVLITLVGVCDSILYKAIANVLMPTVLQPLPESLTQVIRKFSLQLDDWLRQALDSLPQGLQTVKFDLARCFSQLLKRQTSLNHLCQAARTVIHSAEITSQMLDDWINVDLNSIIKQTLYTMDNFADTEYNTIVKLTRDFELLLEDQAPLEAYIEWLDAMVDKCVVQRSQREPGNMRRIARQFLLMWSCFGTRVIRDMTLHSAPSFGSYHLLHLMFDEYVLYTVEHLYNQDKGNQLFKAAKGELSLDILDEILRADPHPGKPTSKPGSQFEDRTSVIRGPDMNGPNCANTKPLSHIDDRLHSSSGYPGFQNIPSYENSKNNGFQTSGNLSPWQINNSFDSTNQFGDKNRFPANFMQPGMSSCIPEQYPGCNGRLDNNYDWYDWSDGNSNLNTTSALIPNMGLMNRNQSTDNRSSTRQSTSQNVHYVTPDINNYSQCPDTQFGRQSVEPHATKRKIPDDVPILHARPVTEFYQHHVSNLV